MPAVSLRSRLLLLAAVAIVPLALMSGIALQALLEQQREQTEQSSLDLTRALATAVDTELRLTISALQTLAATEPFASAGPVDTDELRRLAQRVMTTHPEWRVLLLAEPGGRVIFDANRPAGEAAAPVVESDSLAAVVRNRVPAVGSLARGPGGEPGVPVRIPVTRDGELRYVLTAVVKPDAILRVIQRQRVPPDWIVSVFDAKNARVARSRATDKVLGTRPSASLQALQERGADEGVGVTQTLEGERVLSAYTRLRSTGWTVAIGVPTSLADEALRHTASAYGGGLLLSLGIGALVAFFVARGIAAPIAQLRDAALAVGRGEPPQRPDGGLIEVDAVSQALLESARLRERSAAERESLLGAERRARAAAEQAHRHLELLAGAGSLLSRSLDEETTLAAIAEAVVPALADWCRIDLLDTGGSLRRLVTHHRDPERSRTLTELVQTLHTAPGAAGSMSRAIESGEMLVAQFDRSGDYGDIRDPAVLAFARAVGMRAYCVVPLVARGRTLGAIAAVQAESDRVFSAEDCALVHELAHRAALALDNGRLYAESEAALQEAKVANRVKDEFLAMLGHELRNPLAPIVTSLDVMARRTPRADAPERRIIERQVGHLARLVDDLLDVSRIASGKIRLSPERVDLRDVIGHALELAQPALQVRARPPDIALPARPAWVMGDPIRLAQVVSNLLSNAAKFTPPDGRIGIELRRTAAGFELVLADTGVGIPAELLAQVFERFVQGGQALQRAAGGLGLGLAIARNLVELHGGTIRAESDGPGRGSRFIVTLPAAPADAPSAEPAAPEAAPARRAARILIVDDNADAAESLAMVLGLVGHDVRTAGSAEEAIERLDEFIPEVAFLDIGLPKMDGYDLARALRAEPRASSARLVALTGYGRGPDRRRAIDAGFDEHMVKPVDIDSLLGRLDELLSGTDELTA